MSSAGASQRLSYRFAGSPEPQSFNDAGLVDDFTESERFRRLQAETQLLDLSQESDHRKKKKGSMMKTSKDKRSDELLSAVDSESNSDLFISSSNHRKMDSSMSHSDDHIHHHHHGHHHSNDHSSSHACSGHSSSSHHHSRKDAAHQALINQFIEQANIIKHVCQSNIEMISAEKANVDRTFVDLRWRLMHLLNEGVSASLMEDQMHNSDEKKKDDCDSVLSLSSSAGSSSSSSSYESHHQTPNISDSMKQAILDIFELFRHESRNGFDRMTSDLENEIFIKDDIAKQLQSGDLG